LSNSDECEKEEHSDHNSLVNHFQTKSSEWWTHRKNNSLFLDLLDKFEISKS
jgi:hypothetical protein